MGKWINWRHSLAVFASAIMVAALFPPYDASFLAWFCLLPILPVFWRLHGRAIARRAFAWGWLAGFVSSAIQFSWLNEVSWLGALVLPAYLGIYWGLFGIFAATLANPWRSPTPRPSRLLDRCLPSHHATPTSHALQSLLHATYLGAIWAGLEVLRGWVFTGFGWNPLGVAFHQSLAIAQFADVLGVSGISAILVFFQAVLVQSFTRIHQSAKANTKSSRLDFLIASSTIGLIIAYGLVRISQQAQHDTIPLRSLLVQLNIPQEAAQMLWDPAEIHMAYENETQKGFEQLLQLDQSRLNDATSQQANGSLTLTRPDWVIWPECALMGRVLIAPDGSSASTQDNFDTLNQVFQNGQFQLFYGVNEMQGTAPDPSTGAMAPLYQGKIWNSLAIQDPAGHYQSFQKHHLVIFGETIPFIDQIPLLQSIYESQAGVPYQGSFSPGTTFDPLLVPTLHGESLSVIPSICFEDTVPRLTRKFLRHAPQVIVNVTNDGWFKQSAAAAQHFANAKFRCIEFRRPMLRCANTGVSAAIDTTGSLAHPANSSLQKLTDPSGSHFTRGSLFTTLLIPKNPSTTLYSLVGDSALLILATLALLLPLTHRLRH